MLSRKRRASDTLLPLRAPKQPRTRTNHPLGGNSSPSQNEALLARWSKVLEDLMQVLYDTVFSFTRSGRNAKTNDVQPVLGLCQPTSIDERGPMPSPPPSPPILPTRAVTSARPLPSRPSIPTFSENQASARQHTQVSMSAPAGNSIHQRVQHDQATIGDPQRSTQQKYANTQPNAVASTSKNTLPSRQDPKVSGFHGDTKSFGLMSPPSTQASTSSIRSAVTKTYPEVGIALEQNKPRRKRSVKKYIEREHIHAKQHKARVKEEKKRTREELEKELYSIKRSAGFGSDFASFQSFVSYQARLERLDKTGAFSPSPSLGDLRSKAKQDEIRRHSFPDDVDPGFLQRAIRKAQDALKGPKPPKPFVPTLDQLRLYRLAKDEEIEERLRPKRKPLPTSLPPTDEANVDALFRKKGVIAKCVREQVSDEDLVRLRPAQWLNDEIINFYGQMILLRSEASKENPGNGGHHGRKRPLNVHYFSTFFWTKLKEQGYEKARLAKWTKKIDLFSKDAILIPVNHNNAHWTAATINFRRKRIESYDSMGMERGLVFKLLRQYLDEEHRNKRKRPFNFTGWKDYILPDTPQQENGYDCGVFTCQFLEVLSRGEEDFPFTQVNMPYLRRKMVWEIGNVKLREEP